MRISDWSSDVCSSDLVVVDAAEEDCLVMSLVENCARRQHRAIDLLQEVGRLRKSGYNDAQIARKIGVTPQWVNKIGSASCRESECQYELISGVAVSLKRPQLV